MADTKEAVTTTDIPRDEKPKVIHRNGRGIVLIPQPSDDPHDPLNWPMRRKLLGFFTFCIAGFAGKSALVANQLIFTLQVPTYQVTDEKMLYSLASGLAGDVAGPFLLIPLTRIIGRNSVVFWNLIGVLICQVWAAKMTHVDDYVPFVISRLFCGLCGALPAIIGNNYIMDVFFLHQRGKAFAVFEMIMIFAVVGSATLGGFIAQWRPWPYVFWWTVGPSGAAIILSFCVLQETGYDRTGRCPRPTIPSTWLKSRIATFFPGTQVTPKIGMSEFIRSAFVPLAIAVTPVMILIGAFVFITLGIPVLQGSVQSIYLQTPVEQGGYGFSPLQNAFFTMTTWLGVVCAQVFGYYFNDKIPLWVARRNKGVWHSEYRLANTLFPAFLFPIGLGLYGAALQYHFHYLVLAFAAFLIIFPALLTLPVCYNYAIECFLNHPADASVVLNCYRLLFGLIALFFVTPWQEQVGPGWVFGTCAFFAVAAGIMMIGVIWKGHLVRRWSVGGLLAGEDGAQVTADDDEASPY